jgi:hypothetical protein
LKWGKMSIVSNTRGVKWVYHFAAVYFIVKGSPDESDDESDPSLASDGPDLDDIVAKDLQMEKDYEPFPPFPWRGTKSRPTALSVENSLVKCPPDLVAGVHVLVKVNAFRYVAKLIRDYDNDEDFAPVVGFRSLPPGTSPATRFKEEERDMFDVEWDDIIEVLPCPRAQLMTSTRMVYIF